MVEEYRGYKLTEFEDIGSQAEENSDLIEQTATNLYTHETDGNLLHGILKPDASPDSDHSAEGVKCTLTAGENLVFGEVCYFKSDGKCWKADSSATSTLPVFVMALATISADASGEFLLLGFVRDDSWAWTVGGKIYISSTAGSLTQTVPAGEEVITVGIATHADRMFFNPNYVNVSDVAYNATSWNANYDPATKNAIRDKLEGAGYCQIATGTYTGNGNNNRQITGLGFDPVFGIITYVYSVDGNAYPALLHTDFSSWVVHHTHGIAPFSNRGELIADGFEVNNNDAGDEFNLNGTTYYYVMWG